MQVRPLSSALFDYQLIIQTRLGGFCILPHSGNLQSLVATMLQVTQLGKNKLILFTYKIPDWLSKNLQGTPRQDNLFFILLM